MKSCSTCQHFHNPEKSGMGECRRYPSQTPKMSDFWCGEFKQSGSLAVGGHWTTRAREELKAKELSQDK